MKKLYAITLAFIFFNGCAQTTSMMGPTYTMVKTGSILQAGSSAATSYGIKQALGQSPSEYIISLANDQTLENNQAEVKKCQTFTITEIFFETLDNIDCLTNPFKVLR